MNYNLNLSVDEVLEILLSLDMCIGYKERRIDLYESRIADGFVDNYDVEIIAAYRSETDSLKVLMRKFQNSACNSGRC